MSLPLEKRTDDSPDAPTVTPLAPLLMHDLLSEDEIRRVQQWTEDWLHVALEQKLIRWPDVANGTTIRDIQFCYRSGLTPEDGVRYCFGARS